MPAAMKSDRSPMHSPLSAKTCVGTVEPPIKVGNNCNGRSDSPKAPYDQQALKHGHGEKQGSTNTDKLANQIFVGGIPLKTSPQRFREWADETWPGLVADVRLICSFEAIPAKTSDAKDTAMVPKPRGFGFVTFISTDTASHAVQNQHYVFSGERTVEVKKVHKAALISFYILSDIYFMASRRKTSVVPNNYRKDLLSDQMIWVFCPKTIPMTWLQLPQATWRPLLHRTAQT